MFLKSECYRLGAITKLYSYKGEVAIYLDVDDPEEYNLLESVFVEYDNKLIPFFLERIQIRNNGTAIVKFLDIDSEKQASTILKCGLYLPLETLPQLTEKEFYFHEIEGFNVIDENHGPIGKVKQVLDLTNNPLIEIDYRGFEILIPNREEFILKVDRKRNELYVKAPEGLLEMYLDEEE